MTRPFHFVILLAALAGCSDTVERTPGPTQSLATEPRESLALEDPTAGDTELVSPSLPLPTSEPTFPGLAPTLGDPAPRIADCQITLERTWCLGTCPVYTVEVGGDGVVTYRGKKYVLSTEPVETKIDPARLEPLLRELEELDFLRHKHKCQGRIRDSPGTRITLRVGTESRTFTDFRMGNDCGFREPSEDPLWHANIDRIGKLVDELVHIEQWIGSEAERSAKFEK